MRGSRVGLGEAAARLPDLATRKQFVQTGCALRDTGAVATALSVPLYIKGQRYGIALLGWTEDGSR